MSSIYRALRAVAALLCAASVFAVCLLAGSAASVDPSRRGSIHFRITSGYERVPGGNMLLMRVASLEAETNNGGVAYKYAWVPELAGLPLDPADVGSYAFAEQVFEFARDKNLPVQERAIDADGNASFSDLPTGFYLFYQTVAPEGYETLAPFIVSLPMLENGEYIYDIDASPKPLVVSKETVAPTTEVSSVPRSTEPPQTTTPDDRLPQTGQLKWPIAVLAPLGAFFILLGLIVRAAGAEREEPA